MPQPAQEMLVRNLIEALERLREELDRMELWTAALGAFHRPIPDYAPDNSKLLRSASRHRAARSGR